MFDRRVNRTSRFKCPLYETLWAAGKRCAAGAATVFDQTFTGWTELQRLSFWQFVTGILRSVQTTDEMKTQKDYFIYILCLFT